MLDEKLSNLLTLESFEKWVERQPPDETYNYTDNGKYYKGCALVQYLRANGYSKAIVSSTVVCPRGILVETVPLPSVLDKVTLVPYRKDLLSYTSTYRGLLGRIREAKNEIEKSKEVKELEAV